MRVCIAGGGKVGFYLAKTLIAHKHKVTLIEPDELQCRYLSDALDIPVVMGYSSHINILKMADCEKSAAFVAVTGSDEQNLLACQLAKTLGVKKTVARTSNPENRELLRQLGVDIVVCGTDNLSQILEREIETDSIRQLLYLAGGAATLNEILIPEDFPFLGKPLSAITIPGEAILVSVTRKGDFIIPHGNTVLEAGDKVLCVVGEDSLRPLMLKWNLALE